MLRVVVWNEFWHEKHDEQVLAMHPNGLHNTVADILRADPNLSVTTATLDDPDCGLTEEVLQQTDVLFWWGHVRHDQVPDEVVERVKRHVQCGMGLVVLHSGHHSKPFCAILGTTGDLSWGADQKEIIWNLNPTHAIAAGLPDHFILDIEEMYGEPFYIPTPDDLIFGGWFEHGNMMRSGCTWRRGAGKIFYFQPGHESCPSFHNPYVQRIIENGVRWVAPADFGYEIPAGCVHIKEPIV